MLTHHVGLAFQQLDVAGDKFGLVLLAEHLRGLGVVPGQGIYPKFAQDDRLFVTGIQGVQLSR